MSSLTVWARPGLPPRSLGNAVLWEAFLPDDAPPDWVSLPEFVHREKKGLRPRYQSWLSGISQRELNGVTVAEFMSIRSNLSYWWMTLPTDNSLAVDSPAYRVLRLFALSSVAAGIEFDHVTVSTDRPEVAEAVVLWAGNTGKTCTVDFRNPRTGQASHLQSSRRPIFAALRVFWNHLLISMQHRRKAGRAATKQGVVFIDYLAHLREPRLDGTFRSNYWGPLAELLEDWPEHVNWLHISATYATPKVVRSDVNKCEAFNAAHPAHSLLHSYLDLNTVIRATRDYVQIRRFGRKLWQERDLFIDAETGLDPSPLLHDLVKDQYLGRTAAINSVWINLWETATQELPMQRLGVYLFENQPWELALLSAWQRSHFGKAFAVAHSTMRFWDLRYFPGGNFSSEDGRPIPNSIVVNGPLMMTTALEGGYPENLLSVAEALRSQIAVDRRSDALADLLVLGEYDAAHDKHIIEIAKRFADTFEPVADVVFRPHPLSRVDRRNLPITWSLSQHASVNAAVASSRIVLCGPTTSAALDARLEGKNVVVVGLADALISSPAVDLPGVHLVTTQSQAESLCRSSLTEPILSPNPGYVTIGDELPRWRSLLLQPEVDRCPE